nr:MAG TPA: hypothetical protein [Caudoviricetes sp.]
MKYFKIKDSPYANRSCPSILITKVTNILYRKYSISRLWLFCNTQNKKRM